MQLLFTYILELGEQETLPSFYKTAFWLMLSARLLVSASVFALCCKFQDPTESISLFTRNPLRTNMHYS